MFAVLIHGELRTRRDIVHIRPNAAIFFKFPAAALGTVQT
jgi:hypothetical protein